MFSALENFDRPPAPLPSAVTIPSAITIPSSFGGETGNTRKTEVVNNSGEVVKPTKDVKGKTVELYYEYVNPQEKAQTGERG